MTKEEFLNIKCGDKIFYIDREETGIVQVCSTGEVYLEFPSNPGFLYCFELFEDEFCYRDLIKEE